jgi:hypothetical protein
VVSLAETHNSIRFRDATRADGVACVVPFDGTEALSGLRVDIEGSAASTIRRSGQVASIDEGVHELSGDATLPRLLGSASRLGERGHDCTAGW